MKRYLDFLVFGELCNQFLGFERNGDNRQEQVKDILTACVGVGVVDDAAGLVCRNGVLLNNPLNSRLAVDDVIIGRSRNITDSDIGVVLDDALVLALAEAHLGNGIVFFLFVYRDPLRFLPMQELHN